MHTFKEIRLICGQEIKENEDNLFGEKVYRELSVNVVSNDDSIREKSLTMGHLLSSNMGNPLMVFLGITLLKDECSKLFLRGTYAAFIDVQKHYQLLSELIIRMRSVVIDTDTEDEFQKKTDAVSETLAMKAVETGMDITNIISVEPSSIHQIQSLQCLGDSPSIDIESFLLSTLDKDSIPFVRGDDNNTNLTEDEFTAISIILFALFQQRSNNPPDARFETSPFPQLLSIIPFRTTFLSEDNTLSVLFTAAVPDHEETHAGGLPDVDGIVGDELPVNDNSSEAKAQSPQPAKKKRGGRAPKTTTNATTIVSTENELLPRIAKRARTPNSLYVPPEGQHKTNTANGDGEIPTTTKKRGRKKAAAKAKEALPRRSFPVSQPSSSPSLSDIEESTSPIIHKHPRAAQPKITGVDYSDSSVSREKFHEYDKQNAVLRAQLDFLTQNMDRTAKIQNDTKALCFEILEKGADLTKKGATVATENNAALSTTISTVVAAAGARREAAYSGSLSTTSNNHMMFPVLTAAPPPTIVNLSAHTLSAEESSRLSISTSTIPVTTVQQQQPELATTPTPTSNNSIGLPILPQQHLLLPQTPQQPCVIPQFYPTIQVNAGTSVGYSSAQHQQQYFAQQHAHSYYQGPPSGPYMHSPAVPMQHGAPWMPPPSYHGCPPPGGGGVYFPHNQQPPYRGGYPPSFY